MRYKRTWWCKIHNAKFFGKKFSFFLTRPLYSETEGYALCIMIKGMNNGQFGKLREICRGWARLYENSLTWFGMHFRSSFCSWHWMDTKYFFLHFSLHISFCAIIRPFTFMHSILSRSLNFCVKKYIGSWGRISAFLAPAWRLQWPLKAIFPPSWKRCLTYAIHTMSDTSLSSSLLDPSPSRIFPFIFPQVGVYPFFG